MTVQPYLAHYGVLGMKWGVRKDRDRGSTSNASKTGKVEADQVEKKKGLSDKQKKALKIGAVALGTAVAAYGAYRFYKSTDPKTSPFYDKETGILRKDPNKQTSKTSDTLNVNMFRAYLGDPGSQNNCAKCSAAYDLRQKGYDVHAGRTTTGVYRSEWDRWYDSIGKEKVGATARSKSTSGSSSMFAELANVRAAQDMRRKQPADYQRAKQRQAQETIRRLEAHGPNARGTILCRWETGGGHSFAWETDSKGKARLVEGQLGIRGDSKTMWDLELSKVNPFSETEIFRLDQATPDLKQMMELGVVKNNRTFHGDTVDKVAIGAGVAGAVGAVGAAKYQNEEDPNARR